MEGDRIGGFYESSMTPGKQALFALTLILNESDHAWPLLIDQPEDDLDSRSVYDVLVKYMIERKKGRQIVMVSHNANLVIGADSEQIVVANRHGADRQNENEQQFDYLTGSLEYSKGKTTTEFVLASCGIREHACELLDGGEEAFRKRKAKYKL
jgi:predicted ATP-dependent endonuclease of OLD family